MIDPSPRPAADAATIERDPVAELEALRGRVRARNLHLTDEEADALAEQGLVVFERDR